MMDDVLYGKDLHDSIKGDSAKPSTMSDKDCGKLHRKTIGCIRQCIDVRMFHHVFQETNTKALCEKLKGIYERKTTKNKAFVARKPMNLKLKSRRYVSKHLVNQMVAMKLIIADEHQALLFEFLT